MMLAATIVSVSGRRLGAKTEDGTYIIRPNEAFNICQGAFTGIRGGYRRPRIGERITVTLNKGHSPAKPVRWGYADEAVSSKDALTSEYISKRDEAWLQEHTTTRRGRIGSVLPKQSRANSFLATVDGLLLTVFPDRRCDTIVGNRWVRDNHKATKREPPVLGSHIQVRVLRDGENTSIVQWILETTGVDVLIRYIDALEVCVVRPGQKDFQGIVESSSVEKGVLTLQIRPPRGATQVLEFAIATAYAAADTLRIPLPGVGGEVVLTFSDPNLQPRPGSTS